MAKKIKTKHALILLFLFSFLSGILLIPNTPTEMDSIAYALELRQNLEGHLSLGTFSYHKPLYILFNYLSYLFINLFGNFSLLQAIAFTSVLFGSLSSILVFFLVKLLTKKEDISILAALLFSFSPVIIWFRSLPLSELPSLFFILLTFVLLLKYRENARLSFLICSLIMYGLSLLIRFSNLFTLPLLFAAFGYILYEKKKLYFLPLFSFTILPITSYVFIVTNFFNTDFPVKGFFMASAQHLASLSNFLNYELWAALAYQIINGYTITASVFSLLGLLIIFNPIISIKVSNNTNKKLYSEIILFSLLWTLPLIYNLGIAVLLSRYIIFLIPILSLLSSFGIIYISKCNFKSSHKLYLFMCVFFLASLDLIINYIPFGRYYYENLGLLPLILSISDIIDIYSLILSIFLLLLSIISFYYLKIPLKSSILILIILISLLHALPLSLLLKQKTHYMSAIGDWYGNNIRDGSVIIAGREATFDSFFLTDAEIIEYRGVYYKLSKTSDNSLQKNIILSKIKSSLSAGKQVFISNDNYLIDLSDELRKENDLELKAMLPKTNLRSHGDPTGIFMNYASFASSKDVLIYEIKNKQQPINNTQVALISTD
ncbi:glycosyltransferase family 39 protein [Candidatus Woesearchaeota archaeon]|nr:glycosyltransferase family 39 protein [Candidatus Woesearchaeota archaeon]